MTPELLQQVTERLDGIEGMLPELEQDLVELQQSELQIDTKLNDFDLVTQADVASEERLVRFIRERFPEDGIIAEEGSQNADEASRMDGFRWVLDPIDGTINYANRLPIWAISIGLLYSGEQVGAIVSGPGLQLRYRAAKGQGASCNGRPITVNSKAKLRDGVVVTGFPYDRAKRAEPLCDALGNMLRTAGGVRRFGAAALDFCFVADGRFTGYYEMGLKPWDAAGGSLIVQEAGGHVTDMSGRAYDIFESKGYVVTNGKVHYELVEAAKPILRAIEV